jgi:hypothetical protein
MYNYTIEKKDIENMRTSRAWTARNSGLALLAHSRGLEAICPDRVLRLCRLSPEI